MPPKPPKPDEVLRALKSKLPRSLQPPLERRPSSDGKQTVSRSRTIAAPARTLFALLANPRTHVALDGTGTVTGLVEPVPTRLGRGVQFTVLVRRIGPPRTRYTVVEFAEGKQIAWAPATGQRWRYCLEPVGEARSVVTATFDWSTAAAPSVVERLGEPARQADALAASLERLEALAVGSKPASAADVDGGNEVWPT